ncbi:MAG TPA: Type 1 glutamine amidotransferase-like domain-containing protein [Longimicrobium sp.]
MRRIYAGEMQLVGESGAPAALSATVQPLFLLADSQLLFPATGGGPLMERVRGRIDTEHPRAAYLAASNDDAPEGFAIFNAAMDGVGITRTRLIPAAATAADLAFLDDADLVFLTGGDTLAGWRAFTASGVREMLVRRYLGGAVLMGSSAGAVQLGAVGRPEGNADPLAAFPTLGLVPCAVDVHDEADGWRALRTLVTARRGGITGLGIPRGGGVIYHPDHTVEAVRHPAWEVAWRDGALGMSQRLPAGWTRDGGMHGGS